MQCKKFSEDTAAMFCLVKILLPCFVLDCLCLTNQAFLFGAPDYEDGQLDIRISVSNMLAKGKMLMWCCSLSRYFL